MTKKKDIEMQTIDIRAKAEEAFDNYAKELLLERAFPDYRDGLTPVQRRVLYGMHTMGLSYKNHKPARQIKSARIVGEVMGKYHPHGDCLRGDTELYTLSGEEITIKEATERGEAIWVMAVDEEGNFVPALAYSFRIGQYADEVYKITLSTGEEIVATDNHQFLLGDLSWVKAEDLKVESVLYGGYVEKFELKDTKVNSYKEDEIVIESIEVEKVGKEPMYDFTVDEHENMLIKAGKSDVLGRQGLITVHNSGIYGAMANMGKEWVLLHPLVDFIGNKGTADGDAPASMRYSGARLSPNSLYLTSGLNKKNLVDWRLTYDDSEYEPVYLPAQYPNLLVNGSVGGIAIGYVVDILPHNLNEVIDVAIEEIEGKELSPIAPDFPTGGVIVNGTELEEMYKKGQGRVKLRGRYKVQDSKVNGRSGYKIVFYDVPYGVQKSREIVRIREMIENNGTNSKMQLKGAVRVRDESGSEGTQIAVYVNRDADIEVITELIYKYTQLENTQRYEFLTIKDGQPVKMSLEQYLHAFNDHRRETIIREKESDNLVIDTRVLRLDALIKLDGVRDEVIACIRASDNRGHALEQLVEKFDFEEEQADYLLSLQLSRLTKDNQEKYINDRKELLAIKDRNLELLGDVNLINRYIIEDYERIKEEIGEERRTEVKQSVREVDLSFENVIPLEDTVVGVTPDGHIKRSSTRSYGATQNIDFEVLELSVTTHDEVLVFTDQGQVANILVKDIPEMRWGEEGEPLMTYARDYHIDERVIGIADVKELDEGVVLFSNNNRVKRLDKEDLLFKTKGSFFNIMPLEKGKQGFDGQTERVIGIVDAKDELTVVIQAMNLKKTITYGLALSLGELSSSGRNAKGRRLMSEAKNKDYEDIYLSGTLLEEDYRDFGGASIKDVLPIPLENEVKLAVKTNTLNKIELEKDEEEELEEDE